MINKVLWLCNMVLPEYSEEFSIKKSMAGGWMTGMLHELEKKGIEIDLCFPIYDVNRLRNGNCNGHRYYTFLCESVECYSSKMIEDFEMILDESQPEIVHIWGTESAHTTAMLMACKNKLKKAVVNIQGLVSIYCNHYFADIPQEYRMMKITGIPSIEEGKKAFSNQGKCEIESIKMAQHVIGRTDWDRACVEAINPHVHYYHCDEILRDAFYEYIGRWKYNECKKYSIFVSQASSPIKGFHFLLQALPIILRKYPDTHVYVAGKDIFCDDTKGPYAMYLNELIELLSLSKCVTFLGIQDEKQMVLQYLKANVFVSASIVENESNSLSEARIIGTPSVGSYVGGAYDRIESGVDGFLYPYNEPALLAYYVCKIFENKEYLCGKISAHSVQRMSKLIDAEFNVNRTMDIYTKIIDQTD